MGKTGTGPPRTVRSRRDTPSRSQRARIEEANPRSEGDDGRARSRPQSPGPGQRSFHVRSDRPQAGAFDPGARREDHLDPGRCSLHHVPPGLLHEPACPVPTDGPTNVAADHETGPCRAVRPRNVDYQQPSHLPLALPEHRPELAGASQPPMAAGRVGRCVQGRPPLRKGKGIGADPLTPRCASGPSRGVGRGRHGRPWSACGAGTRGSSCVCGCWVGTSSSWRPLLIRTAEAGARDAHTCVSGAVSIAGAVPAPQASRPSSSFVPARPRRTNCKQQKGRQEPVFALATAETLEL
jgi:hypothetical protein